jgi:inosine/xanthosine triphosphatase
MKTIVVASQNPVKIQAALIGFQSIFPEETFAVRSLSVPSEVSVQPMSDAETLQGATNRARHARQAIPDADYWVGIEGGVEILEKEMAAFAWIVVLDAHTFGKGRSGAFFLPPGIVELVRAGTELGEADDILFGRSNSKQLNGAIGILTGDAVDRAKLYEMAVVFALIPFKNPNLFPQQSLHA